MINKQTVIDYMNHCKNLSFKCGSSSDMSIIEDIISYCEKFLNDEMSESKFLNEVEDCGCPNTYNFKTEFIEDCEKCSVDNDRDFMCKNCWINFLS